MNMLSTPQIWSKIKTHFKGNLCSSKPLNFLKTYINVISIHLDRLFNQITNLTLLFNYSKSTLNPNNLSSVSSVLLSHGLMRGKCQF